MADVSERLLLDASGAPLPSVFGIETEFGITFNNNGVSANLDARARLFEAAGFGRPDYSLEGKPSSHSQYSGRGRLYMDDSHPEWSTFECTSAFDLADEVLYSYVETSRRFSEAVSQVRNKYHYGGMFDGLTIAANTTDGTNSWGSHLNLLTSRKVPIEDIIRNLTPHHVARVVWSGSGHVVPSSEPAGYSFQLSERAPFVMAVSSTDTTWKRPLVNLRDEALASPEKYRRVHDIINDANISPLVIALRAATSSIILRATALGVDLSRWYVQDPVNAIKIISADPTLKATVDLANGGRDTGLGIERGILETALIFAEENDYLPDVEHVLGMMALDLYDRLERDPNDCIRLVDWVPNKRYVESAVASPKDRKGAGNFGVARKASVLYRQIYPKMGKGPQMVMRGIYDYSPPAEVLESGTRPPDNARSGARAWAMEELDAHGIRFVAPNWETITIQDVSKTPKTVHMPNPFEGHNQRLINAVETAIEQKQLAESSAV
jgi:proteasome accessory factor A